MKAALLTYNGVTYELDERAVAGLVARGAIVASKTVVGTYYLALEHLIDEVEEVATVVGRRSGADARGEHSTGSDGLLTVRFQHRDGEGGR